MTRKTLKYSVQYKCKLYNILQFKRNVFKKNVKLHNTNGTHIKQIKFIQNK